MKARPAWGLLKDRQCCRTAVEEFKTGLGRL